MGGAIGALASAIALAWFIDQTTTTTLTGGALIGLYAGPGFVAPAMFADHLFNNRKGMLFLIVAGYPVLGWRSWARSSERSARPAMPDRPPSG